MAQKLDVVALGGNAILPVGKTGTIREQVAITTSAMGQIADLIEAGRRVVLIYCDALNDYLVPYQLTTREYFRNVAALLKPNGAYLINAIDILESGRFLGALVNTAETAFPFVRVFVDGGPVADLGRSRSTFVVACLLQDRNLDDPGAAYRANCRIFELDSEDMGALARRSGGVVLTDTFAPVENLLAPVFLEAAGERAAGQWIERVDSRIQSGDYDAALGLVATALRDSPGDVSLLDRKGQILRETGRHGEAISIYQSILRDRPSDVTALLGAIDTLESRGSVEEALPLFERLLELRPRDAIIRSNFGIALARCERYESAIEQFRAAIEIRPEHADAYNNWAAALSSQGRYEDAIGRYDAALRLRPDLLKAHLGRATALYRLGRFDDSLEAYRRATECDATCLPAHLNMARILESMGRFDEAEAACLRVLAMHPEEPRARQLLERIKQRTRSGD